MPSFLREGCDEIREGDLEEFPFYEAESPEGRGRVSPSHRQLKRRLEHIARVVRESRARRFLRIDWGLVEFSVTLRPKEPPSQPAVLEAIQDLEEFVACQVEGEAEARYQDAIRARRW